MHPQTCAGYCELAVVGWTLWLAPSGVLRVYPTHAISSASAQEILDGCLHCISVTMEIQARLCAHCCTSGASAKRPGIGQPIARRPRVLSRVIEQTLTLLVLVGRLVRTSMTTCPRRTTLTNGTTALRQRLTYSGPKQKPILVSSFYPIECPITMMPVR